MGAFADSIRSLGDNLEVGASHIIIIGVMTTMVLVIILVITYIGQKLTLEARDCDAMNEMYGMKDTYITSLAPGPLARTGVGSSPPNGQKAIRDFCIKTAYNCCSPGGFKNAFVDTCALMANIKQGCRCLDMEIYLVDGTPVVATSAVNDVTIKETYNAVSFQEVATTIRNAAFSNALCPNPNDPMFLNLRIMSCQPLTYNGVAETIANTFGASSDPTKLGTCLGQDYSYENNGVNFGSTAMAKVMGKVIIMVSSSSDLCPSTLLTSSALNEWTNIATPSSPFLMIDRFHDLESTQNIQGEIDTSKTRLRVALPDLSSKPVNLDFNLCKLLGCQFIGMCWQNFDENCQVAAQYFDNNSAAIVPKDDSLINVMTPPAVHAPNKNIQLGARKIRMPNGMNTQQ